MDEHALTLITPALSDLDLREAIDDALWSLDSIRVTKPALEITASEGHGGVSGIVASPMMRDQIEAALSDLPVTIKLQDDAGIQYAAAYALATDSRTRAISPGYQVTSHTGHIHVKGRLTADQAQAVREVVSRVTGVSQVHVN